MKYPFVALSAQFINIKLCVWILSSRTDSFAELVSEVSQSVLVNIKPKGDRAGKSKYGKTTAKTDF